jgi:hypothetical protein
VGRLEQKEMLIKKMQLHNKTKETIPANISKIIQEFFLLTNQNWQQLSFLAISNKPSSEKSIYFHFHM